MVNLCHNALSAIERVTPSLPQRGRQPKGASPPLDPQFRFFFFRCVFTAILHGARVDRPRAPVAPSLSNTVPYRFSTEPVIVLFYYGTSLLYTGMRKLGNFRLCYYICRESLN